MRKKIFVERDNFGYLGVDGRIIRKWIQKTVYHIGFNRLRVGTVANAPVWIVVRPQTTETGGIENKCFTINTKRHIIIIIIIKLP
jgi:hypothetical protein